MGKVTLLGAAHQHLRDLLECAWLAASAKSCTPHRSGKETWGASHRHSGAIGDQRCLAWGVKPRSRRLLLTTKTEEKAIAAPAIIGLSIAAIASGIAATL